LGEFAQISKYCTFGDHFLYSRGLYVWSRRDFVAGFVQSLELLKKSWNLQTSFPDLEKAWKIKIKCGKNGKKSGVFLFWKLQQVLNCWVKFFSGSQILFNFVLSESLKTLLCQHCIMVTVRSQYTMGQTWFPRLWRLISIK